MPDPDAPVTPESLRVQIEELIRNFRTELEGGDLRPKVLALIPVFQALRNLGKALIPSEDASAARDRILYYLREYPGIVIQGDELLVISGIQEYARRLRELRVEFGWAIASGVTVREMSGGDLPPALVTMRPNDYILLSAEQDRDAAHRWNVANAIRKEHGAVREKILKFFRLNVGQAVTNEELRYVAKGHTEWARRVRELRTELGWPIATRANGRPDLAVGIYVLEADRQSPEHDRAIPDPVRREVLRRDGYACQSCGWTHDEWNRSDPRLLELHHVEHHVRGGSNTGENLVTLCNVCHDQLHRRNGARSGRSGRGSH